MDKITDYRLQLAQELYTEIENESRTFLNPAQMTPNYQNYQIDSQNLVKWVKDERDHLLSICDGNSVRQCFELWLPMSDDDLDNSIIPNILSIIALTVVEPSPDYSRLTIFKTPETFLRLTLTKHINTLNKIREEYAEKSGIPYHNPNTGLPSISVLDCMKIEPKKYILHDLIEVGTITLISGKEKIGKTYVLMNMALCMAAKQDWLGRKTMEDVDGSILWCNLDMSRSLGMYRIREVAHGIHMDFDQTNPDLFANFHLVDSKTFSDAGLDSLEFFGNSNAVQALREFIVKNNIVICFIDNLVQIEGDAEENKANDIRKVFSKIKQLRDETGCAFVVIHHTIKDGGRGRGSSDIFAETDLNLNLNRDSNNPSLLLLDGDGFRNTASQSLGMRQSWVNRVGVDGFPMKDANGHPINAYFLDEENKSNICTTTAQPTKTTKSNSTLEKNINIIVQMFMSNGNIAMTKTAIEKQGGLTGTKDKRLAAVDEAYNRGILSLNSAGQYSLKTP